MKVFSFRHIRILFLLALLFTALLYTQEQKRATTSWYQPVTVIIFPINGDNSRQTRDYIDSLSATDFADIDSFFARSSREFNLIAERPVETRLGAGVDEHPPAPPHNPGMLSSIWWSLKLRYWAYQHTPDDISNRNRIRLYVLYHQPDKNRRLAHSLGLQKGLIGVVHAYASEQQNPQNNVVMAHEILHTVGASDKYDGNNYPLYPQGYADPDKTPLHPQRYAEIMAGRIALGKHNAKMPDSLRVVKVGSQTAREINWIQP